MENRSGRIVSECVSVQDNNTWAETISQKQDSKGKILLQTK